MTLASSSSTVSLFLTAVLILPPGWAQANSPADTSPIGGRQPSVLQLQVIDEDPSPVLAKSTSSKGLSVRVTDEAGNTVADTAVALRLPDSGATGSFADGSHSAVIYTDAVGRAHIQSIRWGDVAGVATLRITASKGDQHAGTLVEKMVVAPQSTGTVLKANAAPRLEPAAPSSASSPSSLPAPASTLSAEDTSPLNTIAATAEPMPIRPAIRASAAEPGVAILRAAEPSVSVSSDGSGPAYHAGINRKKWILIGLAIVAGAGAAYAASSLAKSNSTGATNSSISIGAPTVSVGHP